jgi:hypothetical protein
MFEEWMVKEIVILDHHKDISYRIEIVYVVKT